jgi:hypothetical protein
MVKKIISIHIPRTAGGTFGRGVLSQIHFQVPGWHTELHNIRNCERGLIDGNQEPFASIPLGSAPAIHGHFPFKPEYKNHFVATFVREPAAHILSRWRYHRSNTSDTISLIDFVVKGVKNRLFTNVQSKFFADGTVDDFNFVGITDHFDRSVALFFKKIGLENKITPESYKSAAVSGLPKDGKFRNQSTFMYEPTEEEIRIINEHSKTDIELYNKALQKFENDCAEVGV